MSSEGYHQKGLEHHGAECAVCGDPEDVIHHRDGDRTNDAISNLIPLCYACHQKIHGGNAKNDGAKRLVRELGKIPRNGKHTSISVSHGLADELHGLKSRGKTYEDVIWWLIEEADE